MRQSSGLSTLLTRRIDGFAGMLPSAFRFGVVGLLASAVHLGVASLVVELGVHVMISNTIGFCAALIVSTVGHHTVSFSGRTTFRRGAQRFIPMAVAGFIANNVVLAALVASTGSSLAWLKIAIAILVIPPVTFCYAYFFAYKN